MPERLWRFAVIGLNTLVTLIGIWATLRPPLTDVVFTSWWPERIGAAVILVLVPGIAVAALLRPANPALRWSALALNAATVVVGVFTAAQVDLRVDYPLLVLVVVPMLTVVTIWRSRLVVRSEQPPTTNH